MENITTNSQISKYPLMKKSIEIRKANVTDAQFIALLGRITFTETFGHFFSDTNDLLDYNDKTFSIEKIKNGILKSSNVFWIAFVNELPVGYAKLKLNSTSEFIFDGKTAQLQKIYVLKDFHSHKIGFDLQNLLLAEAARLGNEKIWLSVLKQNSKAIDFYIKTGFYTVGNTNFSIGKEDFKFNVMVKDLF